MRKTPGHNRSSDEGWQRPLFRAACQFVVLFGFWLAFSGHTDPKFLVFGGLSTILVVFLTHNLFHPQQSEQFEPVPRSIRWFGKTLIRLLVYIPWLLLQVLIANLQVTYMIIHPKLPVNPRLIQFETALNTEPSQVLLAQSITLTPGTITVDVRQGKYLVHALAIKSYQGLKSGSMQNKVALVFGQSLSPPEPLHLVRDLKDIRV